MGKKFVEKKIHKLTILLTHHVKNWVNRITSSAKKYNIIFILSISSTGTSQTRIEQLRNLIETSHLITITIHTGINLLLHITFVDHRLGLSATHKGHNLQNLTSVKRTVRELDGIEVNNHVSALCSELHRVLSLDYLCIIGHSEHSPRGSVPLPQLSQTKSSTFRSALILCCNLP